MEVHKTKQKRKRSRSPIASKKLKKEKKKKHRSHSSDSSEISVSIKKKSSHKKKKKKDKKKKEKKHKRKATFLDDEGRSKVKEEKDTSKEVAAPKSSSVETHKKRLAKTSGLTNLFILMLSVIKSGTLKVDNPQYNYMNFSKNW